LRERGLQLPQVAGRLRKDPVAKAILELAHRDPSRPRRWIDRTLQLAGPQPDQFPLPAVRADGSPWPAGQLRAAKAVRHRLATGSSWEVSFVRAGLPADEPRRLAFAWRTLSDADRRSVLGAAVGAAQPLYRAPACQPSS
jgi:hypothetical protein